MGTLAFLEQLPEYDVTGGAELTAFLYPHIMGAMRREVEANLGCMALPKRAFQHCRAAYALLQNGSTQKRLRQSLASSLASNETPH